ncbi:serine/threonine-protein phosphatase, partial [candidate division KSB1 bacterium]|nr:serine/threonine-protein phosphatase [candidate division KSB1 bacterium]
DIVEFLARASHSLKRMGLPRLYMALAIGRFKGNTLEIAGTGLPPGLIFRSRTATVDEIPLKGVPLGGYGGGLYHRHTMILAPGDTLILMTDGFPELFNDNGEELGYDKAREIFREVAQRSPGDIIDRFNDIAVSWMNRQPQKDDMTFLALKMKEQKSMQYSAISNLEKEVYQCLHQ